MHLWNIIKHKNLLSHLNTGKEILMFRDIEIDKNKFYRYKSPIFNPIPDEFFRGCSSLPPSLKVATQILQN